MEENDPSMSDLKINLDSNIYEVLINHALSNDKEENMGLLIGNVLEIDKDKFIVNITALILLERMDKRQDRVEISPEQLSSATEYADKLSKEINQTLQIIGWYHSHPNITVWPSHVDISTQSTYQMLDKNFFGLILSVFNDNKANNLNTVEMICFQSNDKLEAKFKQLPFEIIENDYVNSIDLFESILNIYYQIPNILMNEENNTKLHNNQSNVFSLMSNMGSKQIKIFLLV